MSAFYSVMAKRAGTTPCYDATMPFKKTAPNQYRSPSGRKFTQKQVNLYYATNGFSKPLKKAKSKGKKRR